jgi:hypothetical protein
LEELVPVDAAAVENVRSSCNSSIVQIIAAKFLVTCFIAMVLRAVKDLLKQETERCGQQANSRDGEDACQPE